MLYRFRLASKRKGKSAIPVELTFCLLVVRYRRPRKISHSRETTYQIHSSRHTRQVTLDQCSLTRRIQQQQGVIEGPGLIHMRSTQSSYNPTLTPFNSMVTDAKKEEELEGKIDEGRQKLRWRIPNGGPFYFKNLIQRRKVYLPVPQQFYIQSTK